MKPNTHFILSVQDIELIERCLHEALKESDEAKRIHALLGKLHNQKTWYRPTGIYISG